MDIQAEKYSLIEYITQVKDADIIEKIKQFVKATDHDFWNDLSTDQKKEIQYGIDELDKGEKVSYDEIISKHR